MRRLLDREDHVLDELRQEQDVLDIRVQRSLEERRRLVGGDDHDRRARLLADRSYLAGRERRVTGRVQDAVEVPAGEDAGGLRDVLAPADHIDLRAPAERVTEPGVAFAVAGHVDPGGLRRVIAHFGLPFWV